MSSAPSPTLTPEELASSLALRLPLVHLVEALTHPSFSNEQKGRCPDNQRLEFLGDAVLGLCVSELLMERFPESNEGELSLMRSSLVNATALSDWARKARLGDALRLGRGADAAGEREQSNVLADATEALVAAVYLDLGLDQARALSLTIVTDALERCSSGAALSRDAKSELQARVQARGDEAPRYRIASSEGPPHARQFLVVVESSGAVLGEGRGRSRKLAEQAAATRALELLEQRTSASAGDGSPLESAS